MLSEIKSKVIIDPGTSGTKAIVEYLKDEFPFERVEKYFLIEPSVRQLTEATYRHLLDGAGESVGLGSNLVSYLDPKDGNRVYFEVGETAVRLGLITVSDRKFEKLLAKVLVFLGYLVRCELQTTEQVHVELGILLPFDEYEDRRLLAPWLKQILGTVEDESTVGFEFNGDRLTNIRLKTIEFKPEGYGIYQAHPSERVAVLVVGHSDSSWLYFNNGKLITERSRTFPGTGMHDFITTLQFPITYELKAAEFLAKAGKNLNPDILCHLTQTKSPSEIGLLQQAIKEAKHQYWVDRRSQFSSLDLSGLSCILTTGGTANFFSTELDGLFQELFGIRLHWCKSLMLEFFERFKMERKSDLLHRFADCYGYYKGLSGVKATQSKTLEATKGGKNAKAVSSKN
ncbi:ParM/StbA family protein [Chroococcus sp. FPU101]|uniref:ParM/StbA family protein n=1 Tax=Chroococcus sp. FPU101 TaxID=1974212 RepID=UPI001A8DFF65|nr:ParM/StbA family protein [Chroococcus sp. FPU101]